MGNDLVLHPSDNTSFRFTPFLPEHLDENWQLGYGTWQVKDGCLCHVLPENGNGNEKNIISDAPDAESFNRLGTIKYRLRGGGFESVRVSMDVSLQCMDGFTVALDDDAVEWTPYYGMRPVLTDLVNGSRGHEYANMIWPNLNEINHVEIEGDLNQVIFRFNGQELFRSKRGGVRPFRQLSLESFAGAVIHRLEIDTRVPRSLPRKIVSRDQLKIAAYIDFADHLYLSPFDSEMIDTLIGRLADLGAQRIYFMNSIRVRPEALGPDANEELNRNLDCWDLRLNNRSDGLLSGAATIRSCYPFLSKAVEASHKRGLEIYGVQKWFDLGFSTPRGNPSPYINDHFRQTHPDAMMKRWEADKSSDSPVETIRFFKDDNCEHAITSDQINIWISDDNLTYRRVTNSVKVTFGKKSKKFKRFWEADCTNARPVQVITISGLNITAKYFAVVIDGPRKGTFYNRMYQMCEVLDAHGNEIPTTRNLPERPRVTDKTWRGESGFIFKGFTTCRSQTGNWRGRDWVEIFQGLDGPDLGIAFTRGTFAYMDAAPNPAHPATQQFWLDWVTETLDAGVDGIDFRIMNHNNILDWSNYGFGKPVEDEFQKRFGYPLQLNAKGRKQHVEMMGEIYTDFLRKVSQMIRGRGKKIQHHISRAMDTPQGGRPLINIDWNWKGWLEEGLLDAVTLKDIELSSGFFEEIMEATNDSGVETLLCPYLNCIFQSSPTWETHMKSALHNTFTSGVDWFILHQASSVLKANEKRQVNLKFPEVKDVLLSTKDLRL